MAEDRMLSDEILLGLIKANSGGGGGGTSNYNDLSNKPQIGGVTLSGNKSASDLGLVAAVDGKGLSTNDYTDADKAIVGGVTAALAGKQDELTAGANIKIDDDTISVNRWFVPAGKVVYTVITSDENYGQNVHVQRHTLGGAFIDDRTFLCEMYKTVDIDGLISIQNPYASFNITLLKDSDEQQAGYRYIVNPITTPTSNSFTFTMEQEENDNDLIIRSELDAKQDTLTFDDVPTANSNNPVKSGGVKSAIDAAVSSAYHHAGTKTCVELVAGLLVAANEGNVYNMTDSGTTTADFIEGVGQPIKAGDNVGIAKISDGVYKFDLLSGFVDTTNFVQKSQTAGLLKNDGTVNDEIEGDVATLKSGLTNLDNDMNVPDRKNILPCSLADIKRMNIQGTWDGSVYTYNGVTFTVNTNITGYVTSIVVTGQSTGNSNIMLVNSNTPNVHLELNGKRVTYSGCPAGGSENTYNLYGWKVTSSASGVRDTGDGVTFDAINMDSSFNFALIIGANYELPSGGLTFYPMLRLATITDPTFAPYIPSVESRIEAVESGLIKITKESYENITVNAGSKKWVANVGLLTDNVVITAYSNVSDVIAYVATATTTYQIYLYNPTNADITNNVTVMVAKV